MGRVDDILELIDGALGDGISPDAVRWTPDKAEAPSENEWRLRAVWCPFCGEDGFAGERHDCPPSPPREIVGLRAITEASSGSSWWDSQVADPGPLTREAFEATLLAYGELTVRQRQAHGLITDITVS